MLSQTFRALIHSRLQVGMERYAREFPDADVVLFEPAQDDAVIFFANMFSYADRRRLAEHAYRHTLAGTPATRRRARADLRAAMASNSTGPFSTSTAEARDVWSDGRGCGIASSRWRRR